MRTNELGKFHVNFWIEVTSGLRWGGLRKEGIELSAPGTTRYRNFFKNLKTGDFVLHYLTTSLTRQKEKQSSVIGASRIASDPTVVGKKIVARCSGTIEFPKPVPYSELHRIGRKSRKFDTLLRMGMQKYLTQISRSDFDSILGAYPANRKRFSKLALSTS